MSFNKFRKARFCKFLCRMKKGFSLIEVAIAIGVLTLLFGGMLAVFDRGALAARKTQQQAAAYNLARAFLEEYSDWNSLDGLDGSVDGMVTNGAYTNPPAPAIINNITCTPTLTVSDGPLAPAQLKRLDIAIAWTDGTIARNIVVTTLKANY